jgi:hypothetical protein
MSKIKFMHLNKILRFYEKYPKTITFFVCLIIISVRSYERILIPNLWAEDGSIFLREAIMLGWKSLFLPYAGYYHTIPRILAFLAQLLPAITFPYFIFVSTTLIYIATISLFASSNYYFYIKSNYLRFLVSIGLCMVPGLHEVLGNLANLHWILFLYLCLTLLKYPFAKFSSLDLFFIFCSISSTGECILLFPLIVFQLFYIGYHFKIFPNKLILILAFLLMFISLNIFQSSSRLEPSFLSTKEILKGWLYVINNFYIYQPILGDENVLVLNNKYIKIYNSIGTLLVFFLLFNLINKRNIQFKFFTLLICSIAFIPLLTFIVRPNSFGLYVNPLLVWKYRYSFALAPWGLLFLATSISTLKSQNLKYNLMSLFIAFYFLLNQYRFFIPSYGEKSWLDYYQTAQMSIDTGCPPNVSIPIYPDGSDKMNIQWYFTFEVNHQTKECD